MNKIRWKTEEIEVLKNNYSNTPTDKLLELLPNRSYVSIKLKGKDLNLSRYYNKRRIIKLDKLLEDTYESAYWLGFLYADGNFYNNKRLTLTLSIKDENHIKKFIKFLEMEDATCIKYTEINACVSFSDCESVGKLCDRYNIGTKKVLLNLKDKALKFKLPVLKRKWDNINNETCGYININLNNTYLRKEG